MLKNNYIFKPEGIYEFSHSQFNTIRAKSNGNGMNSKKV